jgi:hypothetical protein
VAPPYVQGFEIASRALQIAAESITIANLALQIAAEDVAVFPGSTHSQAHRLASQRSHLSCVFSGFGRMGASSPEFRR